MFQTKIVGWQGTERTRGLHAVVLALFMLLRNSSADSRFFLLVGMGMVGNDSFVRGKTPKVPLLDSFGFDFTIEEGTS